MSSIFISYRREDTASATGRLTERLESRFGADEVFRDLDEIEAGADFRVALLDGVRSARVMLIVIGRNWATIAAPSGVPRLHDPDDYVRQEIQAALENNLLIIPVLVENASLPRADQLPAALVPIIYRNTHEISESRWHHDTARLVAVLERHLELEPRAGDGDEFAQPSPAAKLLSAVAHVPRDFLRLLSEPTRFLVERASGSTSALGRPLSFLLISQIAGAALVLQGWPTRSPLLQFLLAPALIGLLAALVFSVPLHLAWRAVGASHEYHRVLTILLYQCSFVGLGESLFTVVMLTGIAMTRPLALPGLAADLSIETLYATIESLQAAPDPIAWVIASFVSTLVALGIAAWCVMTWGAYRVVLNQTRLRSLLAFILFVTALTVPLLIIGYIASRLAPA